MKENIVAAAIATIIIPCGWMAGASALYCAMAGKMDFYRFPFTQWAQAAPWWRLSRWMTLYICASALLPTLVVLALVAGVIRLRFASNKRPSLYGQTGWADGPEMRRGGIQLNKRAF